MSEFITTTPLALDKTEGCRGTARLFSNDVSMYPIGVYEISSVGDGVPWLCWLEIYVVAEIFLITCLHLMKILYRQCFEFKTNQNNLIYLFLNNLHTEIHSK